MQNHSMREGKKKHKQKAYPLYVAECIVVDVTQMVQQSTKSIYGVTQPKHKRGNRWQTKQEISGHLGPIKCV